jgi:methylglutaconyl-CoA hydratase
MKMTEYVHLNTENGIGTIEFFHPQSNSLPGLILAELANAITKAGKDNAIKVIVLKSAGDKAFCAGASFDELVAINNEASGKQFFSGFANVINAARKCPKFIIGRVQGKAVGGGVGMAAATDYCFATQFAGAKLSELAIGIGPFVVGPAVERKIGTAAFSAMTINATKWFEASWAREKGLYTEVFDTIVEMDFEIMWQGTDHWDELLMERATSSGKLVLSDFTKNAIAKFKAK